MAARSHQGGALPFETHSTLSPTLPETPSSGLGEARQGAGEALGRPRRRVYRGGPQVALEPGGEHADDSEGAQEEGQGALGAQNARESRNGSERRLQLLEWTCTEGAQVVPGR